MIVRLKFIHIFSSCSWGKRRLGPVKEREALKPPEAFLTLPFARHLKNRGVVAERVASTVSLSVAGATAGARVHSALPRSWWEENVSSFFPHMTLRIGQARSRPSLIGRKRGWWWRLLWWQSHSPSPVLEQVAKLEKCSWTKKTFWMPTARRIEISRNVRRKKAWRFAWTLPTARTLWIRRAQETKITQWRRIGCILTRNCRDH